MGSFVTAIWSVLLVVPQLKDGLLEPECRVFSIPMKRGQTGLTSQLPQLESGAAHKHRGGNGGKQGCPPPQRSIWFKWNQMLSCIWAAAHVPAFRLYLWQSNLKSFYRINVDMDSSDDGKMKHPQLASSFSAVCLYSSPWVLPTAHRSLREGRCLFNDSALLSKNCLWCTDSQRFRSEKLSENVCCSSGKQISNNICATKLEPLDGSVGFVGLDELHPVWVQPNSGADNRTDPANRDASTRFGTMIL